MYKYRFIVSFMLVLSFTLPATAISPQYNKSIQTAYKALNSGNYEAAIKNYEQALKFYPNDASLHNNLGVAYLRTNDLTKAEMHYKKAIKLDPSNPLAYSNLSSVYEREQKYIDAAKYLELYLKLAPSAKKVYYRLSELYYRIGNKDLCLKYGEKYVQFSDDKFDTYVLMGESCEKFGDFDKASLFYEKALQVSNKERDRQNEPYVLQELRNCQFKGRINNTIPMIKAPHLVHKLVQVNTILKNRDTSFKLNEMLDLLWADENGKILLTEIVKHKIPIIITYGGTEQTNAKTEISYKKTPMYYLGMVPLPIIVAIPMSAAYAIFHPEYKKETKITVNIGEDIIQKYKNPNSSLEDNMYALMSIMHESAHAVASTVEDNHVNSLDEELTVSMIGYNFASNVLLGRILSHDESQEYAISSFDSLMSDNHKYLPLYHDFRNTTSKLGINLHNYDTYSDLNRLKQHSTSQ